ncbi:MAG TPA: hypothetical protein VJ723_06355, partial [Candidatus Angelobacter sp.]|nr:hypothetical protein [Candidatus Angelobacter sp.]
LNLRRVIANSVGIRRAAEALDRCETVPEFCDLLQKCLEPVGFDGFGIDLTVELAGNFDGFPLRQTGPSQLHYLWDKSLTSSEANWSLTFSLVNKSGQRLGNFTLFRKSALTPLWIDLSVFTSTGFSAAIAGKFEQIQQGLLATGRKEPMPAFKASARRTASD